jgi:hypothetical protein
VDVPSTYQDDNLLSPQPGGPVYTRHTQDRLTEPLLDMLGFKLEALRREGTSKDKAQPIYLDMQVRYNPTNLRPD